VIVRLLRSRAMGQPYPEHMSLAVECCGETFVTFCGMGWIGYAPQAWRKTEKVSVLRIVAATRMSTFSFIEDHSLSVDTNGGMMVGSYVWTLMSALTIVETNTLVQRPRHV
jgi:hypothetical protein